MNTSEGFRRSSDVEWTAELAGGSGRGAVSEKLILPKVYGSAFAAAEAVAGFGRAVRPISSGVTPWSASDCPICALSRGVIDPVCPRSVPGVILRPRSGVPGGLPFLLFLVVLEEKTLRNRRSTAMTAPA